MRSLGSWVALVALLGAGCGDSSGSSETGSSGGAGGDGGSPSGAECGNGVLEEGEECDGAELDGATCPEGSDEGEVVCTAECTLDASTCADTDADDDGLSDEDEAAAGTDPNNPDSDDDGLNDGDEITAGSDPLNPHSDDDGFTDGEEVAGGADPTTFLSWPGELGFWPDRFEQSKTAGLPLGDWEVGETATNLYLTDQFGEIFKLRQFYGYGIVMSVGAVWCGPCNQAAATSEDLYQKYREQGIVFMEVLVDGAVGGVTSTVSDLEKWAEKYDITYPLATGSGWQAFTPAVPTYFFISPEYEIVAWEQGFPGDAVIEARINTILPE